MFQRNKVNQDALINLDQGLKTAETISTINDEVEKKIIMNIVFVKFIGGFVHWLRHGCKTSLKDEVEGRLEATWGSNYDMENYLIGFATYFVILVIVFGLVF